MEADQVAGVVGEGLHAAQGSQQCLTVNSQLVGVVLWNHAVIVRIATLNQSTDNLAIAIADLGIALIEADGHITTVLTQQGLQQGGGFLRQDEGGRLLALDAQHLVAHQLMTVAGNDSQALWSQVEVDTVHHGAQFILGGGKQRTVDVLCQQGIADDNLVSTIRDTLSLRIFVSILYGQ